VLDPLPASAGTDPRRTVCDAVDLVQVAEQLRYHRYWFAQHHRNPGAAGTNPATLVASAGRATESIRVGCSGMPGGHRSAMSVVAEFGLLDAIHPGRVDLGLGPMDGSGSAVSRHADLVQQVVGLLGGAHRSELGLEAHPVPGSGLTVEPWILGSNAGRCAELAGRLGVRFAATTHVGPRASLDAVDAYREAFVPSAGLEQPYVALTADVCIVSGDEWTNEDRTPDRGRVQTQISGSSSTVVRQLEAVAAAAGADEIIVTTMAHSHVDRVRSLALLAHEWDGGADPDLVRRGNPSARDGREVAPELPGPW
jgi:luciferase family oxidoreductase group 1